ncbi:MAG: hypothetical protein ACRD4S_08695 [Candidatus Acidiferrales bacterium]
MRRNPKVNALIRSLASADFAARASAATEIFDLGREAAMAAIEAWLADSDVANLFVRNEDGAPRATVGVAVQPETFNQIRAANGSPRLADVPPDQDVLEFELHFGAGGIRLDILTARDPTADGAIARHLGKFGEGIQQVEFLVHSVDRAAEILGTRFAIEPIYPATRNGADGTRVNFFLLSAPGGQKVLVELVEIKP